jgi:hypothetical protein
MPISVPEPTQFIPHDVLPHQLLNLIDLVEPKLVQRLSTFPFPGVTYNDTTLPLGVQQHHICVHFDVVDISQLTGFLIILRSNGIAHFIVQSITDKLVSMPDGSYLNISDWHVSICPIDSSFVVTFYWCC